MISDPEPKKTEDYLLLAAAKELTGDSSGAVEILFAAQRALPEEARDSRCARSHGPRLWSADDGPPSRSWICFVASTKSRPKTERFWNRSPS